jgi:DnaJ-class molecular chaperone
MTISPSEAYEECPACSGHGEIVVGFNGNHLRMEPCPKCNAEGYVPHNCDEWWDDTAGEDHDDDD